jgi:hypothetical protein
MDNRDLNIILKLQDQASAELKNFIKEAEKVEKETVTFRKRVDDLQPAFSNMARIGTASFVGIAGAIGLSIREVIQAETAQNRLTQILRTATKATDEQISVLIKQADALEKVGVVSADSIIQAQAQLATFDLQSESIERLIPSILDYVVAEKGASATTEDLKQLTNGLAQALQGNFSSLTRTGFVLDEATKELIANGNEVERTTALVKVLDSTYKGFNTTARETTEGSLIAMKNEFGNLMQTVGKEFMPILLEFSKAMLPIIQSVSTWVQENSELTKWILIAGLAISGLVAVVGMLGLVLPAVITGFTLLAGPIGIVIGIIAVLALAITNIVKIMDLLQNHSKEIWEGMKIIFKEAIDWIVDKTIRPLMDWIDKVKGALQALMSMASGVFSTVGGFIGKGVSAITGRASGGPVSGGTPYIVGEKGPELFVPRSSGNIVPNNALGGGGVTVNVYGDVSGRELVDRVQEAIMMGLRSNTRLAI